MPEFKTSIVEAAAGADALFEIIETKKNSIACKTSGVKAGSTPLL